MVFAAAIEHAGVGPRPEVTIDNASARVRVCETISFPEGASLRGSGADLARPVLRRFAFSIGHHFEDGVTSLYHNIDVREDGLGIRCVQVPGFASNRGKGRADK